MVTLIIILVTAGVSILCFYGILNVNPWIFNAYQVWHRRQWHRMLSYGLVHSGWGHLIFMIPILVPGYIFAPLYLLYCWYMAKRNMDNIGHTAHFWGAVYGLVFPLLCKPVIFSYFLSQL